MGFYVANNFEPKSKKNTQRFNTSTLKPIYNKPKKKVIEQPKSRNHIKGWVSILRWTIVILELGASLALGFLTAGASAPISAAAIMATDIGIGLIAASANTAVSAASGQLNAINVGIDYATAFLPLAIGAASAFKIGRKVGTTAAKQSVTNALRTAKNSTLRKLETSLPQDLKAIFKQKTKGLKHIDKLRNEARIFKKYAVGASKRVAINKPAIFKNSRLAKKLEKFQMDFSKNWNKVLDEIEAARVISAIEKTAGTKETFEAMTQEVLKKYQVSLSAIIKRADETKALYEEIITTLPNQIANLSWLKRTNKAAFLQSVENLAPKHTKTFLREIYTNLLSNKSSKLLTSVGKVSLKKINTAISNMSMEGQTIMLAAMRNLKGGGYSKKQAYKLLKEWTSVLDLHDLAQLKKMNSANFLKEFDFLTRNGRTGVRGFIRFLGSKKFNQWGVQIAQLSDPNDQGRMPVELAYQYFAKKYAKYLERTSLKKAAKIGKTIMKKADGIDQAFVNSGGIRLNSSYLSGFKILGGTDSRRICMMFFHQANTNNKPPLLFYASDKDLDKLSNYDKYGFLSPSEYWWSSVGKAKGWWFSRGGKKHVSRFGSLANNLSLFLGLIHIPALKNILSIVSNWTENISKIANKTYNWLPRFTRAFARSAINRTARLFTRKIIGGSVVKAIQKRNINKLNILQKQAHKLENQTLSFKKMLYQAQKKARFGGRWIGRELQRISINVLSGFEGTSKEGYFTFNLKNASGKSGSVIGNVLKRGITQGLPASLKGALLRKGNHFGLDKNGNPMKVQGGRHLISNKRKFNQLLRIDSAFTPNSSSYKGIRKLTKF